MTRRSSSDAGISLVELIVAVALTAIVSTLVVSVFVGVSRSVTRESVSAAASESATVAMREVTRVIRSGAPLQAPGAATLPVFVEAGTDTLTLHTFTDTSSAAPRPLVVRFAVDGGELTETRWPATTAFAPWAFASTPSPPRTVARGLSATGTSTFRYVDATGQPIDPPAGGMLGAADRARIAAVTVRLTMPGDAAGSAPSAVLENTVGIPNLGVPRVGRAT